MLEVGSFHAALHGGVSRRAFLAAGALAPAALGLRPGAAEPWPARRPSHLDTFDPQAKVAAEVRGR